MKGRRNYQLKKLRPQIIDRSRCQNCNARVKGAGAILDPKDPEDPSTLENLHLLCRKCNTLKGNLTWEEFRKQQEEWQARLAERQNARPGITCQQTGLSVKGRSWKEAGCLSPSLCVISGQCDNGEYAKWAKEMDETIEAMYAAYDQEEDATPSSSTPCGG